MVDGVGQMSGCNVRGALGSQARIGEVRELQVGFEFRRIQMSLDPTRGWSWSWSLSWSVPAAIHDPWFICRSRRVRAPEAWGSELVQGSRAPGPQGPSTAPHGTSSGLHNGQLSALMPGQSNIRALECNVEKAAIFLPRVRWTGRAASACLESASAPAAWELRWAWPNPKLEGGGSHNKSCQLELMSI